jgi:hypothetical protein
MPAVVALTISMKPPERNSYPGAATMTAQVHERLILDGQQTSMAFVPWLPSPHPRIVSRSEPAGDERVIYTTACWRRYIGTWELRNARFYLLALVGRFELVGTEPLWADWFSGVLRVPRGRELHYVHMGFGTIFEEELHIRINDGVETDRRRWDNRGREFNVSKLGLRNLPGDENEFPHDFDGEQTR